MNALIQTPTPELSQSQEFYDQLKFQKINDGDKIRYTDGKAIIEINPERTARAGVKLYRKSWESVLSALRHHCKVLDIEGGHLLAGPSGVWIYLIASDLDLSAHIKEQSFAILGNYMGLSLETLDMEKSVAIWEILGFKIGMGKVEGGWVALFNESGFGLSVMKALNCPHLFVTPSLTYFNGGKNLPIIKAIRDAGIPILQELDHFNKEGIVDNVILKDPGGLGMFIFND